MNARTAQNNTADHKNRKSNYITMLNRFVRLFAECDLPFDLYAVLALIAISNGSVL
ncbi:hypothetical protein [Burkholderia cenocepacia]|uniref:hypothetical protein n=1 Tax=Burkholderia cenocepacia TaxID=95486 RepID=UPI0026552CC0|nr:hypothetical protein [Burkholderia cenocepacia]MDN7545443.1 hypothetical protein [Burkholderia cenocepacia]